MVTRHQQSSHAQEMFEQVESFLASELSQTEFCQQHDLAYWTFRYWLKKYQARQPMPLQSAAIPTDFIPLRLQASEPLLQTSTCEIEYPSGIVVRLHGPLDAVVVSQLLHAAGTRA